MDPEVMETLKAILEKDKDLLSEDEKQFLLARRSYLNDTERARFADMIKDHEASLKEVSADEKPAKKAK